MSSKNLLTPEERLLADMNLTKYDRERILRTMVRCRFDQVFGNTSVMGTTNFKQK